METLEPSTDSSESDYAVTVNIELKFTKSKTRDALGVKITAAADAPEVKLTEEQITEKYPLTYHALTDKCRARYSDFKCSREYHEIRQKLETDERYAKVRRLDPDNPKSSKKTFYNGNIFQELDQLYTRK